MVVNLGHNPYAPTPISEPHTPRFQGKDIITCDCGKSSVQVYTAGNHMRIECWGCGRTFFRGSKDDGLDYILTQIWLSSDQVMSKEEFIAYHRPQ